MVLGLLAYPALLFFPAMLIAAFVRKGGYRVGFADSLNRSWIHVLALLFVAVGAWLNERQPTAPSRD